MDLPEIKSSPVIDMVTLNNEHELHLFYDSSCFGDKKDDCVFCLMSKNYGNIKKFYFTKKGGKDIIRYTNDSTCK